jgi:hypothetical protein
MPVNTESTTKKTKKNRRYGGYEALFAARFAQRSGLLAAEKRVRGRRQFMQNAP